MNIQYASDLHIDINKFDVFSDLLVPSADILVLAGDICQVTCLKLPKFLSWCADNWKTVIYVSGNHEYYNRKLNIEQVDAKLKIICSEHGVLYGQCLDYLVPGTKYHILACTLWTNINGFESVVRWHMNDFSHIPDLNIMKWKDLNLAHLEWLEENIVKYGKSSIVVTHHSPVLEGVSYPEYEGTSSNRGYVNDLDDLVKDTSGWIFGHTHYKTDLRVNGVPVVSNPRGYRLEKSGEVYDPTCILTL